MRDKFTLDSTKQYKLYSFDPAVLAGDATLSFTVTEYQSEQYTVPIALPKAPKTRPVCGDCSQNSTKGTYNMAWDLLENMNIWLWEEQRSKVIELWTHQQKTNTMENRGWMEKHIYVCAHQGTGEEKKYEKLHAEWGRKVLTKLSGCDCQLIVKLCLNTPHVLGKYHEDPQSPYWGANAWFM